jgi:hypothetical protein
MGTDIPGESFAQGADLLRDWRQSSWWGRTAKPWRTGLPGDTRRQPCLGIVLQDRVSIWTSPPRGTSAMQFCATFGMEESLARCFTSGLAKSMSTDASIDMRIDVRKRVCKGAVTSLILKDLTDQKSHPEKSRFLDV